MIKMTNTEGSYEKHLSMAPQINIVAPLYNEEIVFQELVERLDKLIEKSKLAIEVIFIDDGSTDNTPNLIRQKCLNDNLYTGITLSRNFGHQLALSAGLKYVNATEAVLVIDGDLQDPPELLDDFYEKYKEGYDVVYAIRSKRKESVLKKWSYNLFYRLLKKIAYIEMPLDSGDFSLISRRVVDYLNAMPEESRFIRGMRSWIGFKQTGVVYERHERMFGKSKYSFKRLLNLAFNGIFNFSEYPVKMLIRLGSLSVLLSVGYLIYTLVMRIIYDSVPSGFTSLLAIIVLFGGVQLIALGLMGEYILRIFFQVKNRPLYIVREIYRDKKTTSGQTIL